MKKTDKPTILIDSSSPGERRSFLKKFSVFAAGIAALGGFTNLRAKNTFSGKEISAVTSEIAYTGSVTIFCGTFAIRDWAFCQGQIMKIYDNQELFSILANIFGGDGRTSFALPDLRGRTPVGTGQVPGLTPRQLGEQFGTEHNTLSVSQMPAHTHSADFTAPQYSGTVSPNAGGRENLSNDPANNFPGITNAGTNIYTNTSNAAMGQSQVAITQTAPGSVTIGDTGASQPFNNMQPSLGVNYIICLNGVYPSRN